MSDVRCFTVEGDPSDVFALAEANGWKITKLRWWQRTYAIPRWMVWLVGLQITLHAVAGVEEIVRWLGG